MLAEYLLDTNFAKSEQGGEDYRVNLQHNLSDAISLLPKLATGLDVNTRFTDVRGMEFTAEVSVFDLLGIDLVHGWLVDPQDTLTYAAVGDKTYNELVYDAITSLGKCSEDTGNVGHVPNTSHGRGKGIVGSASASAGGGVDDDDSEEEGGGGGQSLQEGEDATPRHIGADDLSAALEKTLMVSVPEDARTRTLPEPLSTTSQDSVTRAISSMLTDTVKDAFKTPRRVSKESSFDQEPDSIGKLYSSLSEEEISADECLRNALLVKEFLESHPSQLTVYGISCLMEHMADGQLAVLFRNNHFNVLLRKGEDSIF